jgi:hypothetical protein
MLDIGKKSHSLLLLTASAMTFTMAILSPSASFAQREVFNEEVSLFDLRMESTTKTDEIMALENAPNLNELRRTYNGPAEPAIPEVTFYEFEKPDHLQGLAESLVHGVTIGLPPEYDHYGYELRRYMKSVGNFEVYKNRAALERELLNIKKSLVVFKYWREKLNEDMAGVEKRLETENASSQVRTTYKLNAGILRAFMIEGQSWINANQAMLEFLKSRQSQYLFEDGQLKFVTAGDRRKFLSLYDARERARNQIHQYDPFRIMVY